MTENKLFKLVGDDDSGPADVEDDLDLEYAQVFMLKIKCANETLCKEPAKQKRKKD